MAAQQELSQNIDTKTYNAEKKKRAEDKKKSQQQRQRESSEREQERTFNQRRSNTAVVTMTSDVASVVEPTMPARIVPSRAPSQRGIGL